MKISESTGRPTPKRPRQRQPVSQAAVEVYRRTFPQALAVRMPDHGRRRVLAAITAELAARTPAELADRIRTRWELWRYRDVQDPAAVAIVITRRGYDCPDVRCEDHVRSDTGEPCGACAEIAAEITRERLDALHAADHTSPINLGDSSPGVSEPPRQPAFPPSMSEIRRSMAAPTSAAAATKPSAAWIAAIRRRDYSAARAELDDMDAIRRAKTFQGRADGTSEGA